MSESIIVVGGGTMGTGIACVAAQAGYDVTLVESETGKHRTIVETIRKQAERSGAPLLERIAVVAAIPAQASALLAIEAVPEQFELKREVFGALSDALPNDALLATNTSSLSVGEIAERIENPERVVGMHFFNPPTAMNLVEVVHGEMTSDDALERAHAFAERFGKTAVEVADTPGFIVNRVARPFYLQSMRAYERGVASMEEIDELARGAGFRMGPFALMDLIGNDVNLATTQSVYERTGAERLAPVAIQEDLVAQNNLGRKTGSGFYDYSDGVAQIDDSFPEAADGVNEDERVCVLGFGGISDELIEHLQQHYAHVTQIESDEMLDAVPTETTMLIDVGDGVNDRGEVLATLDSLLPEQAVFFADAYATEITKASHNLKHPQRLAGYGILGSLESQRVVEVVDTDDISDDTLDLAQELFESLGKRVVLVEDCAGLYLGRTIGSIVNEAVIAVQEHVASPDDIDVAMRLGTNYPIGPIAWGREIGGARIGRILSRLAQEEGQAFAAHRSMWVLDVDDEQHQEESASPLTGLT